MTGAVSAGAERALARVLRTGRSGADQPVGLVVECELADGIPTVRAPRAGTEAHVLVRVFTEPIGMLKVALPAEGLGPDRLAETIVKALGRELRERFEECGLQWSERLPTDGLRPPRTPRFLKTRGQVLNTGPWITGVVCTRDRPEGLAALLESLRAQAYERLRILVVDNAPSDQRTRHVVTALSGDLDIHYVVEPRPGLSWARNRAIEASDTEVLAWVDDDEICDRWWAAELARGFVEVPGAGAVTGLVVPAEIDTQSQARFEQYAGIYTARGFARTVFSPETARMQSPLYPLPPFGIGANMAFRRDALTRIGGFDCALGAGTAALAGEDTAALSALLLAGGTIVYQPTSIVRHHHRRDHPALRALMMAYGRGLGAYYASMLARRPKCAFELLRLSRRALREKFGPAGGRSSRLDADFPRDLIHANRIGLLQGPFMYGAARVRARRLREIGTGQ
jgi:GT2 family glycosyltransferase